MSFIRRAAWVTWEQMSAQLRLGSRLAALGQAEAVCLDGKHAWGKLVSRKVLEAPGDASSALAADSASHVAETCSLHLTVPSREAHMRTLSCCRGGHE